VEHVEEKDCLAGCGGVADSLPKNPDNVIEINRSRETAKRLRQKLDRFRAANDEWVSAPLDLATELWNARQMHRDNQAFGRWLAENELDDFGKDDRAALIGMGQHLDEARAALEGTGSRSLQWIWRDRILPNLSSLPDEDAAQSNDPPSEKSPRARRAPAPASDIPLTQDERAKLECRGHIIRGVERVAPNRKVEILIPSVEEALWYLGYREPIEA
jgi:hypothetical protein